MAESKITKTDIEHLKNLARVEFGAKEADGLVHDFGKILGYVDTLRSVDTSAVSEVANVRMAKNVTRKDLPAENAQGSEEIAMLISAFPESDGDLLKVKSIL